MDHSIEVLVQQDRSRQVRVLPVRGSQKENERDGVGILVSVENSSDLAIVGRGRLHIPFRPYTLLFRSGNTSRTIDAGSIVVQGTTKICDRWF